MRKMIYFAAPAATLALCAAAHAVDELPFEPAMDSYHWHANQPHGELPYLELFQELAPDERQATAMLSFDLSSIVGIDPADIVSARLEVQAGYSGSYWNLDGDSGMLSILERGSAFDEIEPNPSPDSLNGPLAQTMVSVGDMGVITLQGAGLLNQVRDWATSPASNFGVDMYLEAVDAPDTFYMAIYSSEYSDPAMRPRLVVGVDNIPTPGVGALLGAGMCCLVRRRRL